MLKTNVQDGMKIFMCLWASGIRKGIFNLKSLKRVLQVEYRNLECRWATCSLILQMNPKIMRCWSTSAKRQLTIKRTYTFCSWNGLPAASNCTIVSTILATNFCRVRAHRQKMVVVIVATNASPPRHKTHAPAFQTSGVRAENNVCPCLVTTVEKEKMSCSSWSLLKFRRGRRPPALNDQIFKLPNKSKTDSESYAVTTT